MVKSGLAKKRRRHRSDSIVLRAHPEQPPARLTGVSGGTQKSSRTRIELRRVVWGQPRKVSARVRWKQFAPLRISRAVGYDISFVECSTFTPRSRSVRGHVVAFDMWHAEGPDLRQACAFGKAPWQSCFKALQAHHPHDVDTAPSPPQMQYGL